LKKLQLRLTQVKLDVILGENLHNKMGADYFVELSMEIKINIRNYRILVGFDCILKNDCFTKWVLNNYRPKTGIVFINNINLVKSNIVK